MDASPWGQWTAADDDEVRAKSLGIKARALLDGRLPRTFTLGTP